MSVLQETRLDPYVWTLFSPVSFGQQTSSVIKFLFILLFVVCVEMKKLELEHGATYKFD